MTVNSKKDFFNSYLFIYIVGILTFAVWLTGAEIAGLIVFVVAASILLATRRDCSPFVTIICLLTFSLTFTAIPEGIIDGSYDFAKNKEFTILAAALIGVLVLSLVIRFCRYGYKGTQKFNMIPAFIFVFVATALAGLTSDKFDVVSNLKYILVYLIAFVMYLVYSSGGLRNFKDYIPRVLYVAGLVALLETVVYYLRAEDIMEALQYKLLDLGWGISNNIAVILGMAVMMAAYLFVKTDKPLFLVMCGLLAIGVVFTFSRGNILSVVICMPFLVFFVFRYSNRKKAALAVIAAFVLLGVACLIWKWDTFVDIFTRMFEKGAYNADRRHLWGLAISVFAQNPLFGGMSFGMATGIESVPHSSLFLIMEYMGIVGLVVFCYHYYQKYGILLKNRSVYTTFVWLAMAVYLFYSFIDAEFFMVYHNFFVFGLLEASKQEVVERGDDLSFNISLPSWVRLAGASLGVITGVYAVYYAVSSVYVDSASGLISFGEIEYVIFALMLVAATLLVAISLGGNRKKTTSGLVRLET